MRHEHAHVHELEHRAAAVIDAPMNDGDGSGSGSGSGSGCCPFTPTNFDPCNIPAAAGPLDVQSTDQYPINTASCPVYMFNSQHVCLLHYTSVTIDGNVTINGATAGDHRVGHRHHRHGNDQLRRRRT